MGMKIFILEDDSERIKAFSRALNEVDYVVANTVEDGQKMWNPPYDVILLDHDLDFAYDDDKLADEQTGHTFAEWLPFHSCDKNTRVVVHSFNYSGARRIAQTMHEKGYNVVQQPFGERLLLWLKSLAHANATSQDVVFHSQL